MRATALFLIRRPNDLDHITPIIWKMIIVSDMRPLVWIVNPNFLDIHDYRLDYLRQLGTTIEFCYDGKIRRIWDLLQKSGNLGKSLKSSFVSKIARRLVDLEDQRQSVTEAGVRDFLKSNKVHAVVVDWQKPDRYCIPQILGAAKQVGVPIIAVPHAVPLQKSRLVTNRQAKRDSPPDFRFGSRFFDLIIVPHQHFKSRLVDSGIHSSRVKVIGSARYCDEWRNQLEKIAIAEGKFLLETSLTKIVYFDHQRKYRLNQEQILNGLIQLGQNSSVCLVVHSAPGASMWQYREVLEQKDIIFDEYAKARDLIAWAEIVVSTTSSLLVDAWLEKKLVLYPKHFHKVDMLFEDWACGEKAENNGEMIAIALRNSDGRNEESDSKNREEQRFLDFVIRGGQSDRDVLTEYVRQIEKAITRYGDAWQ